MVAGRCARIPLLALLGAVLGCAASDAPQGTAGADCYPNGTCNSGLTCLSSGTCVWAWQADTGSGALSGSDGGTTGLDSTTPTGTTASSSFSFFVISLERIQAWGGQEGLGGNLGGLAGADARCQAAAEAVGSSRTWHAFLSVTDDGTGSPVHAIERIGSGPWYDVKGRLIAENLAGLMGDRPAAENVAVWNDGWKDWTLADCLTTELGNCNHSYGDSHDTLTGSNSNGRLFSTDPVYTCNDWTSTTNNRTCSGGRGECWPAIGHSWPAHSGQNWMYSHRAGGCEANINLADNFEAGVGGHGGYGAWYCFAL